MGDPVVVLPDESHAIDVGETAMTGPTHVLDLTQALGTDDLKVVMVYFDAGARTRPHIHHRYDQILYYVSGQGVVALDGGPDVIVPTGGLVRLPEGVIHMHGAGASGPAAHLSVLVDVDLSFDVADVPEAWRRFTSSPE
jgi:quercetin dioxygenase-like cupin family protein